MPKPDSGRQVLHCSEAHPDALQSCTACCVGAQGRAASGAGKLSGDFSSRKYKYPEGQLMTDSIITCDKGITKIAVDGTNVNVLQEFFRWFFL